MMGRVSDIVVVLGLLALAVFVNSPRDGENDDVDLILPDQVDCGRLFLGDDCEFHANARNAGRKVIEVLTVSSSCGCTVPKVSVATLAPNGSAQIGGSVRGSRHVGRFRHRVTVSGRTSSGEISSGFDVVGSWGSRFELSPKKVELRPSVDTSDAVELTVTNSSSNDYTISLPSHSQGGVHFLDPGDQSLPAGKSCQLRVAARFHKPVDSTEVLYIRTNCSAEPMIRCEVAVTPVDAVVITPRVIRIASKENSSPSTSPISVRFSSGILKNFALPTVVGPDILGEAAAIATGDGIHCEWPAADLNAVARLNNTCVRFRFRPHSQNRGSADFQIVVPVVTDGP